MRELKYRAWNKEKKVMIESFAHIGKGGRMYTIHHEGEEPEYEVMQYTGFFDKNRKPIYEGDIVRGEDWGGSYKTINGVVEFVRGGFRINKLGLRWFIESTLEILGNTYENPELLDKLSGEENE